MRRTVLIGAVGLVSALVSGILLPTAGAAAVDPTLTLDPSHGPASTNITMTYAYPLSATGGCPIDGSVTFAWEGATVASQEIDRATCTATVHVTPPRGHNGVGDHLVTATGRDQSGIELTASARFVVDPPPSATPTPAHTPSPGPSPSPTGSCQPDQQHAAGPAGYLLAPPLAGSGDDPGFVGAFTVTALTPATALPLGVNLVGTPPVTLTVIADQASQGLAMAMAQGTLFPCLRVDLPGGPGYEWVNYAFANVLLSSFQVDNNVGGGDQLPTATLDLAYASAAFAYKPTQGALVTGTDDAAVVVPTPSSSCQPDQQHAAGPAGYLLAPPLAGSGDDPGFVGAFTVTALTPATALPLGVNLVGTPPVTLTVIADQASQGLAMAMAQGTLFPCLRVDLPGGPGYEWVNYAFANVLLSSFQVDNNVGGGDQLPTATLDLAYASAAFAYKPTQGALVTGTDDAPANPPGSTFPWLWVFAGVGFVAVGGAGLGWWLLKHKPPTMKGAA